MQKIELQPNAINGLGEPVSIISASIGAGMAIYGAVSSYNKGIEAERAAAVAEWDAKRMEAREYREGVLQPQYEEAEMNLILQEYQDLQNGLKGLGKVEDFAAIIGSATTLFTSINNAETQKTLAKSNERIQQSKANIEQTRVKQLELQAKIQATQEQNNTGSSTTSNAMLYGGIAVGTVVLVAVTAIIIKKQRKK